MYYYLETWSRYARIIRRVQWTVAMTLIAVAILLTASLFFVGCGIIQPLSKAQSPGWAMIDDSRWQPPGYAP
jgi:hypothetical protein